MIDYIDAPLPYIIGIPRTIWENVNPAKIKSLPPDVAVYDIDKKKLIHKEKLPDLPKDIVKKVSEGMQMILKNSDKNVN
jgi:hypothetical protein